MINLVIFVFFQYSCAYSLCTKRKGNPFIHPSLLNLTLSTFNQYHLPSSYKSCVAFNVTSLANVDDPDDRLGDLVNKK